MSGARSLWICLPLTALVTGLVACGGGSGAGNGSIDDDALPLTNNVRFPALRSVAPTEGADLTVENYEAIGAPLFGVVRNSALGGGIGPSGVATPSGSSDRRHALAAEARDCAVQGTIAVVSSDADGDGKVSPGDWISVVADNCQDAAHLAPLSGSYVATYNAVDYARNGNVAASEVAIVADHLTLEGYGTVTGRVQVWSRLEVRNEGTGQHTLVRYLDTSIGLGDQVVVYNIDLDRFTSSSGGDGFDVAGGFQREGETYAVKPIKRFVSSGGLPPAVGALTIVDFAGDNARMDARNSTTFDLAFSPKDSAATDTRSGLLWADYGNQR